MCFCDFVRETGITVQQIMQTRNTTTTTAPLITITVLITITIAHTIQTLMGFMITMEIVKVMKQQVQKVLETFLTTTVIVLVTNL